MSGSQEVDQLCQALHAVAGVFDLSVGLDRFLRDIPVAQRRCLVVLSVREGATMQELAVWLGAKAPAMSQIVDRLVKRGMVERRTDPQDRRVCRLYLDASGRSLMQRARDKQNQRLAQALDSLEPGVRDCLKKGLNALVNQAGVPELS